MIILNHRKPLHFPQSFCQALNPEVTTQPVQTASRQGECQRAAATSLKISSRGRKRQILRKHVGINIFAIVIRFIIFIQILREQSWPVRPLGSQVPTHAAERFVLHPGAYEICIHSRMCTYIFFFVLPTSGQWPSRLTKWCSSLPELHFCCSFEE